MLKKEFTSGKLNIMKWRAPSGEEKVLRLKEEMSVKWRELGQNVGISNAKLTGFQEFHLRSIIDCMDAVIIEWMQKGSQEVNCMHVYDHFDLKSNVHVHVIVL